MAGEFQNGRKVVLFIDTVTPITTPINEVTTENAIMVACLIQNGFQGTTSPIATTTKCSGSFAQSLDGEKGWTITASGLAIGLTVGDLRKNHNALFKLWKSGAKFWAFLMDQTASEDSVTLRYGVSRIDQYNDDMPDNEAQAFDISLTGDGEPGDQDNIAPVV